MIGIAVTPGAPGSERLAELEDPQPRENELLVQMLALGVCGTDREIVEGQYGWPPPGRDWLVLGHESIAQVRAVPGGGEFSVGDLVVGVVRRPDPEPCPCCARGEFDMCRNGRYRERGIKELDGYGAQLITLEPEFAVKLDPSLGTLGVLTEPTSVVAKASEQVDRVRYQGCRPLTGVLVTGAGPIGLLAALLGMQRGLRVHVLDRADDGPKPALVRALGATYHTGSVSAACRDSEPDIVLECTGVPEIVVEAVAHTAPDAVTCLLGVSPTGRSLAVDVGSLNNELVLQNDVVLGSVNANHRHFAAAAAALSVADRDWLGGLITRRVPLERWHDALDKSPTDIKTIIEFSEPREMA
jgi:threonine dehydrogenase-like Zn-dependent dehydrogenase